MKKLLSILCIAALSMNFVVAQTADEIIEKHLNVLGGIDKLKTVQTVSMEGKINANGMEIGMNMLTAKNKGFKMTIEVMGMKGWTIMTPDSGWVFMPFQGQTKPDAMTADQLKEGKDQLDLEGELVNYKEKGHTVEYLGMDDVEGTDCHKLKVLTKSGNTHYILIDPNSFHMVRRISKQKADGKEFEMQMDFANYKEVEGGYLFPHTVTSMGGPVEFTKITVNGALDDNAFVPVTK